LPAVDFGQIVTRILQPYGHNKSTVAGPALPIGEKSTNAVALIFHELATNAAKYGALSTEQGKVAIGWTANEKDIRLDWMEAGGPQTQPPVSTGFGSRLIGATVQGIGGEIEYEWKPDGLQAHVRLPVAALRA
jgi:two-component sensor histidine kinase